MRLWKPRPQKPPFHSIELNNIISLDEMCCGLFIVSKYVCTTMQRILHLKEINNLSHTDELGSKLERFIKYAKTMFF